MPLYDEGLSRAKTWVNNYMMNQLAPNMGAGGMVPDMGPMGVQNPSMNLPSAPASQTPTGGTPAKGGKSAPTVKPAPVPILPRPQDNIAMGQLASVPDYVAKFLIDLSRKILGLPEGGMQALTENPAMGLPSGPSQPTQPYIVGEGGPELFTPQTPGQITPISRQYGTPEGQVDTPEGPIVRGTIEGEYPSRYIVPRESLTQTPTQIFPESWNVFPPSTNIGNIIKRKPIPGFEFEKSVFGEPTEMVKGPTGTYEQAPTVGFTAPSYTGPRPWRNVAPTPPTLPTPEGLAKWGITKDTLPTGETRYTLPGTEGTMTLPSGWNAAEEGRKYMAGMEEGIVYGGYPSRPMELPTGPESRTDINPEQARYNAYLADKELREAAGLSPRRGMAEYEYSAAGMRMTPRERLARTKSEGELAKQYYANIGLLPEAELKRAQARYYTELPDIQRQHYAEMGAHALDAMGRPTTVPGGYWLPDKGFVPQPKETAEERWQSHILQAEPAARREATMWGEPFDYRAWINETRRTFGLPLREYPEEVTKPTWEQFKAVAKERGSKMGEKDLKKYYIDTYGQAK